jgi:hypothetical protein
MIEPSEPLKTINQESTQTANTDHLPVHSARAKGLSLSFRPSLQWPGAAPLLRGGLVAIFARVNDAPFARFRHRRLVAAETPAASGGDAPRYSGDYDPATVGPGERPVQPPRPSCSTQTFKVPSEAGGETSVSVVRCNGQ